MRRTAIPLLVALMLSTASRAADACGDKFLLVGRGPNFQRAYAAMYPGHILVYARTGSKGAIHGPQLEKALKHAGHRVTVVEDAALFNQALQSGGFDIVLADVADAPGLDSKVAASPSSPIVLYVMNRPGKAEAEALQRQYNCRLNTSDAPNRYLKTIDDVMKARVVAGRRVR